MDSRLTRWIDGILEAGWLIALIIAPLFFNVQSDRVFEPDKIALLRSIALVMAAAWLIRFIDRRSWQHLDRLNPRHEDSYWRKPFVVVVGLLVLVYLLSTIFSVNPRVSLLGSYQRLQGTYSTFSYLVIFAMMAGTIRTRDQIQRVVTVIIITSIPVAFYGVLQRFELDPLPWGGDVSDRVAGHLGNAIFIAAYLIMVVPLTLARILDAFSNILGDERLAVSDVIRSSIYIFTLALQFIAIYWSGSRGPLLGLLVGLFAFMLVLLVSLRNSALAGAAARRAGQLRDLLPALFFLIPALIALLLSNTVSAATSPLTAFLVYMGTVGASVVVLFIMVAAGQGWRWLWLGWMMLALFVGGWLIAFNLAPASAAELPVVGSVVTVQEQWRDLPTIGSFGKMLDSTSSSGREKSGRVRVLIWEGVVDLIAPHGPLVFPDGQEDRYNFLRPLLGYGPESMYVAYNRFYPPELATVEARNASPDRSHNETFDALVITGWLGFLAWQAVYLSVVFFAFRYLGVVGSRRDGLVLLGLMAGGGLIAGLLARFVFGSIYLGVAVPVGIIGGIIVYLVYYALAGQRQAAEEGAAANPFYIDRLLMNALVAAVLAHYVEIHFGIAIGSTRLLFFSFAALMVALSAQKATQEKPEPEPVSAAEAPARPERRRRRTVSASVAPAVGPNIWPRLVSVALLLTFMVGLIGITFITYSLPPGKEISSSADLGIMEIFRQSLLQHAKQDFRASPYIYMMIIMTWALGWLIFLSEMIKEGQLDAWRLNNDAMPPTRQRLAGAVLAIMAAVGIAARFIPTIGGLTVGPLAQSLLLGWGLVSAIGAAWLLLGRPGARLLAGAIAVVGISIFPALLIAGSAVPSLILAAVCLLVLFLAWDKTWRFTLGRLVLLTMGSALTGLVVVLLYTARYKEALFFRPAVQVTSVPELRALEALSAGGLLSFVYVFAFIIIVTLSFALAWPSLTSRRQIPLTGARFAIGAMLVLLPLSLWLVAETNLQVIQADMTFKRGRPFDDRASATADSDPEAAIGQWENAIAVYNGALSKTPTEDFYYLFLGRSLLERSTMATDDAERLTYITEAETRLKEAQSLSPLNTDHTANLARLYARWSNVETDPAQRQSRLDLAKQYYQTALTLSPQNSIVRGEYARLLLDGEDDCDGALRVYDESVTIDPFYTQAWLVRADAYVQCAAELSESEQQAYYATAADSLQEALNLTPSNVRAWVQLTELSRRIGKTDQALAALEQARIQNTNNAISGAELDYIEAKIRADRGELDEARRLAEAALTQLTGEGAAEVQAFIDRLGAQTSP